MDWQTLLGWSGPALDVAGLAALGAVLWQLRRDPTAAWRDYEAKLRELQESLRLLVLQAEGEARELDRRLAAHADELRALRDDPPASLGTTPKTAPAAPSATLKPAAATPSATPTPASAYGNAVQDAPGAPVASLAERVQQLAAARTPITEIARRLSLPVAEARVLAGLTTGGLAFATPGATPRRAPEAKAAEQGGGAERVAS